MHSAWPAWRRSERPADLVRYVQRGAAVRFLPHELARNLPGPSDASPLARLRRIIDAFAACGVEYVNEPVGDLASGQIVRAPDEVFLTPRHATCLDLAVAFAGTCLDAGLHPMIVILDPKQWRAPSHAIVVVWLGGEWQGGPSPDYPLVDVAPGAIPNFVAGSLRARPGRPGAFAALDVALVARPLTPSPSSVPGSAADRGDLVAVMEAGAARLTEGDWAWALSVDVGLAYPEADPYPFLPHPGDDPLVSPYLDLDEASGPLRQLRARHGVVPFQRRDELDILVDWCETADDASPRLRLLYGVGGAGKTHLTAELAHRLAGDRWYTGFLTRDPDDTGLQWLGRVASPVLAIVDYPEATRASDVVRLIKAAQDRAGPTCVLLTARAVGDWWRDDVINPLRADGYRHVSFPPLRVEDRHPHGEGVFRRAAEAFAVRAHRTPPDLAGPPAGDWTTLDLVMLAWLAAAGRVDLPTSRHDLHEMLLGEELSYWHRTVAARAEIKMPHSVLRALGACVTLLTPRPGRLADVLSAVPMLSGGPESRAAGRRESVAAAVGYLLPPDTEDGTIAVQPDPVADHLAMSVFGGDAALLARCLAVASADEEGNACRVLTRAADAAPDVAAHLADVALRTSPTLWRPAFAVVAAQGGVFGPALERDAVREDTSLPLDDIAGAIPPGHGTLRGLALVATERTFPAVPGSPETDDAAAFANLAVRQADMGLLRDALANATTAAARYRRLAADDASFTPHLAIALNNLSVRLTAVGDRVQAHAVLAEAVDLYRSLASIDHVTYRPDLAMALHNLARCQGGIGRRAEALHSATEAVTLRRALLADVGVSGTEGSARDGTPGAGGDDAGLVLTAAADLASSLNNLAVRQGEVGRREEALESAREGVRLHRGLAEADPGTYLDALATSLEGLAMRQADVGRPDEALATVTEAVGIRRALVRSTPEASTPPLAGVLAILAERQAGLGLRQESLASAREAVEFRRALAAADPDAHAADLASAVVTLASRHSEAGDREQALAAASEAVDILRPLVSVNPEAFSAELAGALNNRSVYLAGMGRRAEALRDAQDSVGLLRDLAAAEPGAFDRSLASSLTNLANHHAEVGEQAQALTCAADAVAVASKLFAAEPGAFAEDLATALTNVSIVRGAVGELEQALADVEEAVALYRDLAEPYPAAFAPVLAASMKNLGVRQAAVGRLAEALNSADGAVRRYRELAAGYPGAFEPDLAMALNNLAGIQCDAELAEYAVVNAAEAVELQRGLVAQAPEVFTAGLATALDTLAQARIATGDRKQALADLRKAVAIGRQLAASGGDAFLPILARSLNNLAFLEARLGKRDEALRDATEVLELHRRLAAADPGFDTADVASALSNIAFHHMALGHRRQALEALTEAVARYRELYRVHPDAVADGFATALVNLSDVQVAIGEPERALASSTEAVALRRERARSHPAHLPALIRALVNQADIHTVLGRIDDALAAFDAAQVGFPPAGQAELLAARGTWRSRRGDEAGALADLASAAGLADSDDDIERKGHARRVVRAAVLRPGAGVVPTQPPEASGGPAAPRGLPPWAVDPVPTELLDVVHRWVETAPWDDREAVLRDSLGDLLSQGWRDALDVVALLRPEDDDVSELRDVVAAAGQRGIEQTLSELGDQHRHAAQLTAWLTTPTWAASREYLREHPGLAEDPRTLAVLSAHRQDPQVARHLGIALLHGRLPLGEIYEAVADVRSAVDTAMTALERGDLETVWHLMLATPDLAAHAFAGPYLTAVLLMLAGPDGGAETASSPDPVDPVDATAAGVAAAAAGTVPERKAGAARLRRLARHRAEWAPALISLADAVDVPDNLDDPAPE